MRPAAARTASATGPERLAWVEAKSYWGFSVAGVGVSLAGVAVSAGIAPSACGTGVPGEEGPGRSEGAADAGGFSAGSVLVDTGGSCGGSGRKPGGIGGAVSVCAAAGSGEM